MSIVQIGGFYTANNLGGHMALPFAAGGAAMKMLRMLYKAKRKTGKGFAMAADKAGKAGFGDITHLKAKGLIPRSDGKKKVSDKYK